MLPQLLVTCLSAVVACGAFVDDIYTTVNQDEGPDILQLVSELQQLQSLVPQPAIITPNNRTGCPETPDSPAPPNRVNTTARLAALRREMASQNIDAYVMYNGDQHLMNKPHFQRVLYISGFSGSSGYAAVTQTQAAMWADGRYFLQAEDQMDCNWILMKIGQSGYPSLQTWLTEVVAANGVVGGDPRYISTAYWNSIDSTLSAADNNITMKPVEDLVDDIWTEDRPPISNNPLIVHELKFTGRTWQDKNSDVRSKMEGVSDVLVLASLDDIAWLFNLRGTDLPTSPLFDSFALIKAQTIRFYLRNFPKLLEAEEVRSHLEVDASGNCLNPGLDCIQVKEYEEMLTDLEIEVNSTAVSTIWVSSDYNYAIYSAVQAKRYVARSPIQLMKAVKNSVEQENYFKCQVRDSAAVVDFMAFLEERVLAGEEWTELSASAKLTEIRSEDEYFLMDSFGAISAAGSNAAIIHYRPDNNTDAPITTDNVYLLDSGGQYFDGTTDVTRTFHFGTPTDVQKDAYTRVLIGHIELAAIIWPDGLYGSDFAAIARIALWSQGLDYNHGTGHGIGYALNVHEGPGAINLGFHSSYEPLEVGMFLSDEPGYYEDGSYGIRLENIQGIQVADTPHNFGQKTFVEFRAATLVPYEPKLIKFELLNERQRHWLNIYNKRVREETGAHLLSLGKQKAYDWLMERTDEIPEVADWNGAVANHQVSVVLAALSVACTHIMRNFYL